jgi:hypothetical protein
LSDAATKYLTNVTAILSVTAVCAVAWLAFRDGPAPAPVRAAEQRDATSLRQIQFAAQQDRQRQTVVQACIPRLLGESEGDRRSAIAMLFALYPNDAKNILQSASASLPERSKVRATLHDATLRAESLAKLTGEWAVVLTNDPTLADAGAAAYRSRGLLSTPVEIYRRDNRFMTLAVGYPCRADAESAAIALRDRVQDTAFVVNLREWCPNRACTTRGYYDCGQ